jgi:hypothetical protein
VAWGYVHDVVRRELVLLTAGRLERHAAGDEHVEMVELAELGSDQRLEIGRPAPTGLEDRAADGQRVEVDKGADPVWETPSLVRPVEALPADRPSVGIVLRGCPTQGSAILGRVDRQARRSHR